MSDPRAGSHLPRIAVVLAAGKGTRMRSEVPKVLHPVAGRPLLAWVLDAARDAGCARTLAVIGHGGEAVRERFAARAERGEVVWVEQREQRGTGHALAQAAAAVRELTDGGDALLMVLSGDVPLLVPATLERLAAAAAGGWGAVAVAELERPGSLGRVIGRRREGSDTGSDTGGVELERIVEAADASAEELAIRTVNAGLYALPSPAIFARLAELGSANAQGELYLTDAVVAAARDGAPVALVELGDPAEALGVNDREDLARVHRALLARHARALMRAGVTVLDPARTVIEPTVRVAADTVIHPDVSLFGATEVGAGCTLHQGVWARDSTLAEGVEVKPYSTLDGARVGAGCTVGPFARLRPGTVLLEGARVGNFVELKKTRLGAGAKASHLTYLGDTEVGADANIGAGVVTCNYDGVAKHRTTIGEHAFVGSDTMLVAPVKIGDRASTGAGSVINQDVPDEALGIARARQRNIPEWAARRDRRRKDERG